jgi:Family of unknown function (DUF6496)
MAAKKSHRKYGRKASKSVESAMRRRKSGTLRRGKQGHGGRVTSRKQAIAIGLSEAREKGDKVPPPPRRKRSTSKRSTSSKSASARKSSSSPRKRTSATRKRTSSRQTSSSRKRATKRK